MSGDRPMPGTVLPGEKAACSIWAKKFSGLRFSVIVPTCDQRIVRVRPGLGQVERVEAVGLRVRVGHDLHRQRPARMLAARDRLEQVAAMEVGIGAGHVRGFVVGEERHALVGVEVVLHPELLAGGVDPHVGVRAVAVHVAPGARQAALAHQVGHLVRGLGIAGPEVPLHVVVAQARVGQPLLAADEVRELHRVAHEEDRRVVADEVVVAFARCRTSARSRARRARCRGCPARRRRWRSAPASRSCAPFWNSAALV